MEAYSAKLRRLGIAEQVGFGPTLKEFRELIESHGLNMNLNRMKITSAT